MLWNCGLDQADYRQSISRFCEKANDTPGFLQGGNFFDLRIGYQLV